MSWFKNRKAKHISKMKLEIARLESRVHGREMILEESERTPWYFVSEYLSDKEELDVLKLKLQLLEEEVVDRRTNPR